MHSGKAIRINNEGIIRAAAMVKASEVHNRSDNEDAIGIVTKRTILRLNGLKSDNRNSADRRWLLVEVVAFVAVDV